MNTVPLRLAAEVTLGRMRSPATENGPLQRPYLRAANVGDGVLKLDDVKTMHFDPDEQRRYALKPGDVLVTEASGSRNRVGQTSLVNDDAAGLMFQNTLIRLRPSSRVFPRYLYWWSRHAYGSGIYAHAAQGLGIWHLGAERLRALSINVPPWIDQRRIANFLDDQVKIFDQATGLRKRRIALLQLSLESWLEDTLINSKTETTLRPLAWLSDPARPIQYGIVLPGPDHPGGVPIIKGGDVAAGRMSPDLLSRTTPAIDAQYSRSRVTTGDLVISIRGSFGELQTVPSSLENANLTQDSARIAPFNTDATWLKSVLETPSIQGQMAMVATGAMVKGINIFELRRLSIPTPSINVQQKLGNVVFHERQRTNQVKMLNGRFMQLLAERKQALITAAVTGQLDVTTARSGLEVDMP